jgi:Lrp/AsnC family transcriptional regulator for asnA, asnC and gidA
MTLDKVDREILAILQKDSSKPFVEIANELGVTDGTIHQRVKKLKKLKIIKRFTLELDYEVLGLGSLAYASITVNPGFLVPISRELSTFPNILEVNETHTQGDIHIKIRATSQEEIRDIVVNEIRKIEGISSTELIPVYKSWKEDNNLKI